MILVDKPVVLVYSTIQKWMTKWKLDYSSETGIS